MKTNLSLKTEAGEEIYKLTGFGIGYNIPEMVVGKQVTAPGSECMTGGWGSVGDVLNHDDACYAPPSSGKSVNSFWRLWLKWIFR